MGLRIWMPLNGDIKNYGFSSAITANSNATVNTSGKIGSCYSFNNSNSFISIDSAGLRSTFKGGSYPFSIAMWVYHADASRAILFGDYSLPGNINFNVELKTDHTVRFYWNANPDYTFASSAVALNNWTHVTITYSGTELKCYLNGNLVNTRTGALAAKDKTSGLFYLGRDSRTGETTLNGRLNDFRVYDHCLSDDEIKQISQALVLGYPLNDADIEPTTNLCKLTGENFDAWRSYGFGSYGVKSYPSMAPALSGQVCQVTDGSTLTSIHNVEMAEAISGCPSLSNGGKMTLSAYVKGSENTIGKTCFIHVYGTNGTNTQSDRVKEIVLTGEWQRVSGQFTWRNEAASGTTYNIYVVCQMSTGQYFYFSNVQFEHNDHVTPYTKGTREGLVFRDCSGYNRHGSTTSSAYPIVVSDSARNSESFHFTSNSKNLTLDASFLPVFKTGSVEWWAKIATNGTSGTLPFTGQTTGYYLAASSGWTGAFYNGNVTAASGSSIKYYIDGVEDNTPPGADSKWHHYVVTGVDLSSWTKLLLNNYSSAWNAQNVYYSNIRFYNTILSANDVSKEYHRFAAVYKNHAFATSEFIEDGMEKISIGTNGVLKGNLIEGDYSKFSVFPDSGNAQAAEFIEII